ncbi:MAG TPA: aminotransferase class III-fold pyridoxal phosphate-dependent enzyme [Opitutaceae bacterium]|jgi:adenosylmethionine-8-amino-7-oxononanoate aminotransferase
MRADSPVWHPFAQMAEFAAFPPLMIVGGKGGWLFDADGRQYLDGNASIWTNVHGHNDPDLNAALLGQLQRTAHSTLLGLKHPPAEQLAHALTSLAPKGLDRVFYSDNGAGAVEVALKQSFQFWQLSGRPEKRGVIGMAGGYHGDTFGAMAAGDSELFHGRFRPWFFPARHFKDREELRSLLQAEAGQTACVIVEPGVQGAAGMRLQPAGLVAEIAELCRQHDVHLILDEVFVGFGRLGEMTVSASEGITPDFLCLAKGLTAGYLPLAATLTSERIFNAFLGTYSSGKAFYHGHTFTGNPLACAVALENIRKLQRMIDDGILARRAAAFAEALESTFGHHPNVSALRHRGFAAALDIAPAVAGGADPGTCDIESRASEIVDRAGISPENTESNPAGQRFAPDSRIALQVCLRARAHGLLLRPLGDTLLLVPPLCLDESELRELVKRTAAAIDDVLPKISETQGGARGPHALRRRPLAASLSASGRCAPPA